MIDESRSSGASDDDASAFPRVPVRGGDRGSGRGRWVVVGMFAFAVTATGLMYLYWKLQIAPFLSLQRAIAATFPGSRPRVEGGQRKMHKGTPKILRVTMKVDFDPQADEPRAAAFANRLAAVVADHENLAAWEQFEVHFYWPDPEKKIIEWTRVQPTSEMAEPGHP